MEWILRKRMSSKTALGVGLVAVLAAFLPLNAETCIVSGDTARNAAERQASDAGAVSAGGSVTAGTASGTALETRVRTEATGNLIPLDTRAPRGLVVILS